MHDLVGDFYEAAVNPALWRACCTGISRRLGATSAMLFVEDRGRGMLTPLCMPSYSTEELNRYGSYYHAVDPFVHATKECRELGAVLGPALVKPADFVRSELWNDFIAPGVRSFHFLCSLGALQPDVVFGLAVHRPPELTCFEENERERLQDVLPHVRRALQLGARLELDQLAAAAQAAVLEQSGLGIVVCDGRARVLYANARGEEAWHAHGLRMGRASGLDPGSPRTRAALHRLIFETSQGGAGGKLALCGAAGSFSVSVCRLPGALAPAHLPVATRGSNFVLVQIRPARAQLPGAAELRQAFGLTGAEAAVALALAAGKSGQEVAQMRKVSITTVRGQVRLILGKTGVSNLRSLTSLLTGMV